MIPEAGAVSTMPSLRRDRSHTPRRESMHECRPPHPRAAAAFRLTREAGIEWRPARIGAATQAQGQIPIAQGFDISVPAWRARRLRTHLNALLDAGRAAREADHPRRAPEDLAHRAEARRWLAGWDGADGVRQGETRPPTARQLAKLSRWQVGAGRLRPADGAERQAILEAVATELLSARPVPRGAIAAAHRETVRRCREAGLPAPKASRYRRWLKLTRGV